MTDDRRAVGFRVHSGWAAASIVAGTIDAPRILRRCKVVLAPSAAEEFTQPYHVAAKQDPEGARAVIARAERSAQRLAMDGLRELLESAPVSACAIVTSRARLPDDLASILASHALVHAAEGNLFREALARAAVAYAFDVERFVEQDLAPLLDCLQVSPGPPWTKDEKLASLAGLLALERRVPVLV
ncbi:MAG: hypothetical protein JO101_11165 [Candidatus Eremiobacteraeota bacterium]|nr:hypothetical protein [Candidatus Eremiobacteraeota bacterium]MBV8355872.1 hypothetical protein [Candidatus Eremiobacteraeota bacterium]